MRDWRSVEINGQQEAFPRGLISEATTWSSTGWWVASLLGLWGVMIGVGNFGFANICFVISGLIFLAKLVHVTNLFRPTKKGISCFLIGFLFVVLLVVWTIRWTNGKAGEADQQKLQLARLNQLPDDLAGEPASSAEAILDSNPADGPGSRVVLFNTGNRNMYDVNLTVVPLIGSSDDLPTTINKIRSRKTNYLPIILPLFSVQAQVTLPDHIERTTGFAFQVTSRGGGYESDVYRTVKGASYLIWEHYQNGKLISTKRVVLTLSR